MRLLSLLLACSLSLLSVGCSLLGGLDARGDKEPPFAFQGFWDRGPQIGAEDPANPGFDKDGNKIPTPEVGATYTLPPITTGIMVNINDPKVVPTIGVKLADIKMPYVRWFDIQAFGGYQEVGLYCGKRWTSVFEVTTGIFVAHGFDDHDILWGIGITLSKF